MTAASGAVSYTDSYVKFLTASTSDVAFLYRAIDLTKNCMIRAMVRCESGTTLDDLVGIYEKSSVPTAGNTSTIEGELIASLGINSTNGIRGSIRQKPTWKLEDFQSLTNQQSISVLANWAVDYGTARCFDSSGSKRFECYHSASFVSCYTRHTVATSTVNQWAFFRVTSWGNNNSIGPAFRMTGSTGNRYYVRVRNSDEKIEWARETGNSSFSSIEVSANAQAVDQLDWLAFSVTGTGSSTVVKFWKSTQEFSQLGPDYWGPATWTSTQDPTIVGGSNDYSVNTGDYVGMSYYQAASASYDRIDNFTWGPYSGLSESIARDTLIGARTGANSDWYDLTLESKPDDNTIRATVTHANKSSGAYTDTDQGVYATYFGVWRNRVTPVNQAYICLGKRYNDAHTGDWRIDFTAVEETASLTHGVANSHSGTDGAYHLKNVIGYGSRYLSNKKPHVLSRSIDLGAATTWDDFGMRAHSMVLDGSTYVMAYEGDGDAFFPDAEIGFATASDAEGPWTKDGGNPIVLPSLIGGSVVSISGCMLIKDDTAIAAERWKMLVMGTVASYLPRIYLLTCATHNGTWAKYSGSGTNGSVIDASTGWRANGVNDPVVIYDTANTRWLCFVGGYQVSSDPADGWSIGVFESTDGLKTWAVPGGVTNPIIAWDDHGGGSYRKSTISSISNQTVTVQSGHGSYYAVDAPVLVRDTSGGTDFAINRVRSVSGDDVEMFHRLHGWTTSNLLVPFAQDSISAGGSIEFNSGASKWTMFPTVFQPFRRDATSQGAHEVSGRYTADNLVGPWTLDGINSPGLIQSGITADRELVSHENIRIVRLPHGAATNIVSLLEGGMLMGGLQSLGGGM